MTQDGLVAQIEKLEQFLSSLSGGGHPICQQHTAEVKKYSSQMRDLEEQKQAAIKECQKEHLPNTGPPSTPAYEKCVLKAEEAFRKKNEAVRAEWKSAEQAFQAQRSGMQNETLQQIKELRAQAETARKAQYEQRAKQAEADNIKAWLEQMKTIPIETLQQMEAHISQYPPEVQAVMRQRLEDAPPAGSEPEAIPTPPAYTPEMKQQLIDSIDQLPPGAVQRMQAYMSNYPPEVQAAIRKRIAAEGETGSAGAGDNAAAAQQATAEDPSPIPEPQPAARPDPNAAPTGRDPGDLYDPGDYHSPFPMLDTAIKQEIRELDPRTVQITQQVLNGLLEFASGRKLGNWVEDSQKVKKSFDTFIKIVTDKSYDSDAAIVAVKELSVVVAENAAGQTLGRVKTVSDLLLLAVRENVRNIWGDSAANGLPNDLYDAVRMIRSQLPSTGQIDPGPAIKSWNGNPWDLNP